MMPPAVLVYEEDPEAAQARAAVELSSGRCVIYPTDTVYGLLAHHASAAAYGQIFDAKQRSTDQPLALLVHHTHPAAKAALARLADEPELARRYASGELTIVLEPDQLSGLPGEIQRIQPGPVGLRQPADERTRGLLACCGGLVWATSANQAGQPAAASAPAVRRWLASLRSELRPLAVVSRSPLPGSASSVVEITAAGPRLLR